ncbi:hypothetical protein [Dactylosporangium darangshiense]|uniref:hypothetical protein n=1 Tax=Dactylosporangium darangshiense TaxID=579108 RepID=UPI00363A6BB2
MPLVATLLHRALGVAPVVLEQPELVVALGSLLAPSTAAVEPAIPKLPPVAPVAPAAPVAAVAPVAPAPAPAPAPVSPAIVPVSPAVPVAAAATPVVPFSAAGPVSPPPVAAPYSPPYSPPVAAAMPPPASAVVAPVEKRRGTVWLLATAAALVVAGLLGIAISDYHGNPPLHSGFFSALLPKPFLILLAMTLTVAVTGRPAGPAYRVIGPALYATGGAMAALFVTILFRDAGHALTFADGAPLRLAEQSYDFLETVLYLFALVTAAAFAGGAVIFARRSPAGAPRRAWRVVLWVAAGVAFGLGTVSPVNYRQWAFMDAGHRDVDPLSGAYDTGGALSWWAPCALGLALSLTAWLLVGAALRTWVSDRPRLRLAGVIAIGALGVLAIVTMLLEIARMDGSSYLIDSITSRYWDVVALPDSGRAVPWVQLIVALAVIAGIAVPSAVRARR